MARLKLGFDDRVTVGLRATIIAFTIIAFSFLLNAYFLRVNYFYADGNDGFVDLISLTPVLFSFLWTVISLSLNYFKGRYRPGVDVGMELSACCVIAGTVWWLIMWLGWVGYYYNLECNADDYSACTQVREQLLMASEIIAAVGIVICGLIHFTLFVKACRETHLRRRMSREARLIREARLGDRELHIVVISNGKEIELA